MARDTRGVTLDGSDAGQVYVPLPLDRFRITRFSCGQTPIRRLVMRAMEPAHRGRRSQPGGIRFHAPGDASATQAFLIASLSAAIASAISLFGLLLASMGIYSTMSYVVVLRTREVGIRMAIGAKKRDILALMMRGSPSPWSPDAGWDGARRRRVAAPAWRALRPRPVDPMSFAGASLLFLSIALVATWLPSRRATRVDPLVALRDQ